MTNAVTTGARQPLRHSVGSDGTSSRADSHALHSTAGRYTQASISGESMARQKSTAAVDRAAAQIGNALGTIVGRIEALKAAHPHPTAEAREAWIAGHDALAAAAVKAGTGAGAVIGKAERVVRQTKKAVARGRKTAARAARRVKR